MHRFGHLFKSGKESVSTSKRHCRDIKPAYQSGCRIEEVNLILTLVSSHERKPSSLDSRNSTRKTPQRQPLLLIGVRCSRFGSLPLSFGKATRRHSEASSLRHGLRNRMCWQYKSWLPCSYKDLRHARDITTGMLQSIFSDDEVLEPSAAHGQADKETIFKQAGRVDRSLSIDSSMAYRKRSSSERKRIDMAVFFALLRFSQVNCAHRAHYMLVDEVFDSLDAAGRKSVIRWCEGLVGNLGFVLVITHSEHLAGQGTEPAEDGEVNSVKYSAISVRMSKNGVVFDMDSGQK